MIEVEKKFQPTEEQLAAMLKDAQFIAKKTLHDIYYDYPDYRFFKGAIRLRNRNGSFELKLRKTSMIALEVEDKKEIEKYFGIEDLESFVKNELIIAVDYIQEATLYKKGEFTIDVSKMSYGYDVSEIELLVEKEEEEKDAENKILNFLKEYNVEIKKFKAKPIEYLRIVKPDVYNELYGQKG
jgi:adenylate cyclase class IV